MISSVEPSAYVFTRTSSRKVQRLDAVDLRTCFPIPRRSHASKHRQSAPRASTPPAGEAHSPGKHRDPSASCKGDRHRHVSMRGQTMILWRIYPRPRGRHYAGFCNKLMGHADACNIEDTPCRPGSRERRSISGKSDWCGREDSNFHGLPHSDLNAARLPIPPRPHVRRPVGTGPRHVANRFRRNKGVAPHSSGASAGPFATA